MNYLIHHGIKGQKWGVRRFQNPDGSLTSEGLQRQRYRRRAIKFGESTDDVNKIYKSLNKDQKALVSGGQAEKEWIDSSNKFAISTNIAMRHINKYGDIPVSFVEVWDNGGKTGEIAIATNPKFQGRGYALKGAKFATDWFNKYGHKTLDELRWDALDTNPASIKTAKKAGFVDIIDENDPSYTDAKGVHRLVYRGKKR